MADWSGDMIDIGDAIEVSSGLAVSLLRSKWCLSMCAVTCQYLGSHVDHGETVLEFRWAIKSVTSKFECKDTVVLGLELVAKESVHVPPGLHEFLEERDQPRRVAIEAALAAQSLAARATGMRISCKYLGQALGDGAYGMSPLDWQYSGAINITKLSFRWRVWVGRAILSEEVSVMYKHVMKEGVTFPRRFQFVSDVAKQLPQCACDSVRRFGASFTQATCTTCEILGIPKPKQQGSAESNASTVCLESAALHEVDAFEANPWLWPSDMQHSKVRVFVRWSLFVPGLPKYVTSAALYSVLERGYFPAPADFSKGSFLESSQLCAPATSNAPRDHPAATRSDSCSEDATDDESAPAAKVARVEEISDGRAAFSVELCTSACTSGASREGGRQPPAVAAESGDGDSNDNLCGLGDEDVAEMQKDDAERKWEQIELKAAWGEPDQPPWIMHELQEEAENNRPLNGTHLSRNAVRRLQRTVRMDRKARELADRMIKKHRHTDNMIRFLRPTPQQVSELFGALPCDFARQAGIPQEDIDEMARSQTFESIDFTVRSKLWTWYKCAELYLKR